MLGQTGNNFGPNGNQPGIRITRLLITESGTYNNQFRRPYETQLDANVFSTIRDKISSSNNITPVMLGDLAQRFVVPSAGPELDSNGHSKIITIAGGWGEQRLRFQMEVVTTFAAGGEIREIVQGFTDYVGLSMGNHLDPAMVFHINSVVKTRNVVEHTPLGRRSYQGVIDSSHILVDNNYSGMFQSNIDERMRPEDVFSAMTRAVYSSEGTFVDARTANTSNPVLSQRKNGIPSNYVASILSSYQNAAISPSQDNVSEASLLGIARDFSSNQTIVNDAFIKAISQLQGVPATSHFTMRDLMNLDPNVVSMTSVVKAGPLQVSGMHNAGSTATWDGSDIVTQTASILSNSVSALLMELGLTGIHFRSTNRNLTMQAETVIGDYLSFSNQDMSRNIQTFVNRFHHEVLNGITWNNQIGYELEMRVDLLGDTWISLRFGDETQMDFVQPSFADSLIVPVLSGSKDHVQGLANDFNMFVNSVIDTDIFGMRGDQNVSATPTNFIL